MLTASPSPQQKLGERNSSRAGPRAAGGEDTEQLAWTGPWQAVVPSFCSLHSFFVSSGEAGWPVTVL